MAKNRPTDKQLLEPPAQPFTRLKMFVCTYEAQLHGIDISHAKLIKMLQPKGAIKVLNCNYGHMCQPGYEEFLKHKPPHKPQKRLQRRPKTPPGGGKVLRPATTRKRKLQGDGTCFNSAIEVIIVLDPAAKEGHYGIPIPPIVREMLATRPNKHYNVKTFPTTGKTQVPGVILPGHEDGAYVARVLAKYLTEFNAGEEIPGSPGRHAPVTVVSEQPIMKNFKFELNRSCNRIILNLKGIIDYLECIHSAELLKMRLGKGAAGVRLFRKMLTGHGGGDGHEAAATDEEI